MSCYFKLNHHKRAYDILFFRLNLHMTSYDIILRFTTLYYKSWLSAESRCNTKIEPFPGAQPPNTTFHELIRLDPSACTWNQDHTPQSPMDTPDPPAA